jgi:hypothetical protein
MLVFLTFQKGQEDLRKVLSNKSFFFVLRFFLNYVFFQITF